MGAGSSKAHQSYTVAPATTSSGSVSQVPAASVADLESLAAEPGHDSAAAVLLVDPVGHSEDTHRIVPLKNFRGLETVWGDPDRAGAPFVIRIQDDAGFVILPHTHL